MIHLFDESLALLVARRNQTYLIEDMSGMCVSSTTVSYNCVNLCEVNQMEKKLVSNNFELGLSSSGRIS